MGGCASMSPTGIKKRTNTDAIVENASAQRFSLIANKIKIDKDVLILREQIMRFKYTKAPVLDIKSNMLYIKRQNNPIAINPIDRKEAKEIKSKRFTSRQSQTD